MATPLFVAFRGSDWRSHVETTWRYLQQNYRVTGDEHCATHVHVSVEGGYSLAELKRIAGSVVHFEPAFDVLVPPQRRSGKCEFSKSSWLDSYHLALQNRSRAQSVSYINSISNFESLLLVMNPDQEKKYGWNFLSIEKYYTVEFRKAQASTTSEEALSWAELAMSFIQAALEHGSLAKLREVPSTVGGLRWFLGQSHVPGLNEPERLQWFWTGKDMNEFVVGLPMRLALSREEEKLLEMRRKVDMGHIVLMTQTKRMPYWRRKR
jgi:Putative amidoligase enzyme